MTVLLVVICIVVIIIHRFLCIRGEWKQVLSYPEYGILQNACCVLRKEFVCDAGYLSTDNFKSGRDVYTIIDRNEFDVFTTERNECREAADTVVEILKQTAKDAKYKFTKKSINKILKQFRSLNNNTINMRIMCVSNTQKVLSLREDSLRKLMSGVVDSPATSQSTRHISPVSPKLRFSVLKRDEFTCRCCGAKGVGVVLNVVRIDQSKVDSIDNLITICSECNDH